MTKIQNFCLMVTYTVVESVWVLAESEDAARSVGEYVHLNGTRHHTEIDRKPIGVEIIGVREVLQ